MIVDDQDINFTPRSQKLLQLCKEIATKLNHKNITTDHLFAAFFELKKSRCIDILHECGLDINRFKTFIYKSILLPKPKQKIEDFNIALEVKEVIKDATTIAKDFEHSWVSAEHIFLSFLKEPSIISDGMQKALKVDLEAVTERVLNYLCDSEDSTQEVEGGVSSNDFWSGGDSSFTVLEKFATNLTKKALEGKLDPVYGREKETAKLQDVLNRRKKNNAIIVGEAGVGKTAVVEGLVQNIVSGKASYFLNSKIVYELNLSSMIAGTKYRGEFEARIKQIVEEAKDEKIILFVDEIHTLIGAGDAEGGLDAANILKPALSSGEITIIGATTFKEYRSKFVKDKALQRRFQPLVVNEPDKKATFKIIKKKKNIYENFHGVLISDDMLYHVIEYADKYIFDNQFPDKAIDLMDLACSHLKVKSVVKPNKMKKIEDKLTESFMEATTNFNSMNDEQNSLFESLKCAVEEWTSDLNDNKIILEKRHLFEVLATKTNIPVEEFLKSDVDRHLNLQKKLKKKIIGQDEAIASISKCLLRHKSGLGDESKPIGSFLFLGTTGVGKTYVAKTLADNFFLSKDNFYTFGYV
jgi:ATP-dependent Clp protease ATP-binding subunit ClpC